MFISILPVTTIPTEVSKDLHFMFFGAHHKSSVCKLLKWLIILL